MGNLVGSQTFLYEPRILDGLAHHGLKPLPSTSPERLRDVVRDLYKYEIRNLRDAVVAGRLHKAELAPQVEELRKRYWLLSLPTALWTIGSPPPPVV